MDAPTGFADAIVIAGPPTSYGSNPGVVRVRDVSDYGFEMRFQEWDYRQRDFQDSSHGYEHIPYLVLLPGRYLMSDGSVWEVGAFDIEGTVSWSEVQFAEAFAETPHLFLAVQTENGTQAVTARVRNVTNRGFNAALFEEEALNDGHAEETVGHLAVYSPADSGTLTLDGVKKHYLLQTVKADERWTPVLSHRIKVEEDQSRDDEVNHCNATVHVLAVGAQLLAQQVHCDGDTTALRRLGPTADAPVEWGLIRGIDHVWRTLPFTKTYKNPVVIAKPASSNGGDPGVIRLEKVSARKARLRYQEWDYLNDFHAAGEDVFYMVAEAGIHNLGGLTVEADSFNTTQIARRGQWQTTLFDTSFGSKPIVLSSVMTSAGADAVTTRIDQLDVLGFDLAMDEQDSKLDGHARETIGWVALERGAGMTGDGRMLNVFFKTVDDTPTWVHYPRVTNHSYPTVLGDLDSTKGLDPVSLRYANPDNARIGLKLEEEASADFETSHAAENVGIFFRRIARRFENGRARRNYGDTALCNAASVAELASDRARM